VEGMAAIGGLALLVALAIWIAISEAKSGATTKEALKATREVVDAMDRFNKARRESAGLPRRVRIERMLQELRASSRPEM